MILLNGRESEWQEGLTVAKLLQIKKYTYPRIVVSLNNKVIPSEEYAATTIKDGDDVRVIHLMAGG